VLTDEVVEAATTDDVKGGNWSVIPDFANKTRYSLYDCPRSIAPHIPTKSVHR
jgi:hypothetical protein